MNEADVTPHGDVTAHDRDTSDSESEIEFCDTSDATDALQFQVRAERRRSFLRAAAQS